MLMWMGYATLAGALLSAAGAVVEHTSPWLSGRRRVLWLAIIVATLSFTAAALVSPGQGSVQGDTIQRPVAAASATPTATQRPTDVVIGQAPASSAPPVINAAAPVADHRLSPAVGADAILLALWLAGTTLCLTVLAISAWRVARMRASWRERVLAGVPVFVSHDVGPAVIGLVHHGIVVPAWVEALGEDEQRTVMTHEREHVRAGDPLLLWGATLLVAIVPWNASLWYALRRLRHAIEIDCDVRVLRSRPDTHAYCTLLLDVGERTLAGVAPVAALAEPSTLLERRIDAMTRPRRVARLTAAGSAAAAMVLLAAACFTPRPDVAPAARVSALVAELGSLLSRDSVRQSLSPEDRQRLAQVLHAADDTLAPGKDATQLDARERGARDSVVRAAWSAATRDSVGFPFGAITQQIARDSFPSVFLPHDDAITVLTVFDAMNHPVANYVRAFPLDEVFDVTPAMEDSVIRTRSTAYILSRVVPSLRREKLNMFGTETRSETPHTVFLFAVLMADDAPPRSQDPADRARALTTSAGAPGIEFAKADSVARRLYPETFAPHPGLPVVGLIFSAKGELLRHGMHAASHDEVFVPERGAESVYGEFSRGGNELLSLVFDGMPERAGRWSTVVHRTEQAPVLVWTVLPEKGSLPTPRAEVPPGGVAGETSSQAHREARVTLSGAGSAERWIRAFSTSINLVEAGAVRGTVRDTLRLRLPATVTVNLGPGGGVTFESEDKLPFTLSALIAGTEGPVVGSGGRIVLGGSGAGLKAFR